jgi:uncharacterized protein YndB with AHSA1/START domain
MQRLIFKCEFARPPGPVFEYFAEHENLEPMFGAKITRLSNGDDGSRNGVGSARRLKIGPLPAFDETVTAFQPDQLIEYRITRGSPLRQHVGELRFIPTETGTQLEWSITFTTPVPGLEVVIAEVLRRRINQGLAKADPPA